MTRKSSTLATCKAADLSGTSIVSHPDHLYQVHLFERFSLNLGPEGAVIDASFSQTQPHKAHSGGYHGLEDSASKGQWNRHCTGSPRRREENPSKETESQDGMLHM
jgi:hypothetical protein